MSVFELAFLLELGAYAVAAAGIRFLKHRYTQPEGSARIDNQQVVYRWATADHSRAPSAALTMTSQPCLPATRCSAAELDQARLLHQAVSPMQSHQFRQQVASPLCIQAFLSLLQKHCQGLPPQWRTPCQAIEWMSTMQQATARMLQMQHHNLPLTKTKSSRMNSYI